jgi:hypothetical protein
MHDGPNKVFKRRFYMIVHKVTPGTRTTEILPVMHKRIYVGCVQTDVRYRDMMINFRQRWEFYTHNTFDFLTSDRSGLETEQWKQMVEETICESDGVMIMVSEHTAVDSGAAWEIERALANNVPVVGVDIRKKSKGNIPQGLEGKMTRYGWEWFAGFIDGL